MNPACTCMARDHDPGHCVIRVPGKSTAHRCVETRSFTHVSKFEQATVNNDAAAMATTYAVLGDAHAAILVPPMPVRQRPLHYPQPAHAVEHASDLSGAGRQDGIRQASLGFLRAQALSTLFSGAARTSRRPAHTTVLGTAALGALSGLNEASHARCPLCGFLRPTPDNVLRREVPSRRHTQVQMHMYAAPAIHMLAACA